jgi:hypothetical protein
VVAVHATRRLPLALETDEQYQFLEAAHRDNAFWSARAWDWIRQLNALTEALSRRPKHPPWYVVEMFWIRLAGVLFELAADWKEIKEHATNGSGPMAAVLRDYFDALDVLRKTLTDEELLVADYLRNRAAHLRPRAYSLKWDRKSGKSGGGRTLKSASRSFPVAEINEILDRMSKEHGDVHGVTFHFAARLLDHTRALVSASAPLHSDKVLKEALEQKKSRASG